MIRLAYLTSFGGWGQDRSSPRDRMKLDFTVKSCRVPPLKPTWQSGLYAASEATAIIIPRGIIFSSAYPSKHGAYSSIDYIVI